MLNQWLDKRSSAAALCLVRLSDGPTNSNLSRSADLRCVWRGTSYLHLCERWTWHYKRFCKTEDVPVLAVTVAVLWQHCGCHSEVGAAYKTLTYCTYFSSYISVLELGYVMSGVLVILAVSNVRRLDWPMSSLWTDQWPVNKSVQSVCHVKHLLHSDSILAFIHFVTWRDASIDYALHSHVVSLNLSVCHQPQFIPLQSQEIIVLEKWTRKCKKVWKMCVEKLKLQTLLISLMILFRNRHGPFPGRSGQNCTCI